MWRVGTHRALKKKKSPYDRAVDRAGAQQRAGARPRANRNTAKKQNPNACEAPRFPHTTRLAAEPRLAAPSVLVSSTRSRNIMRRIKRLVKHDHFGELALLDDMESEQEDEARAMAAPPAEELPDALPVGSLPVGCRSPRAVRHR